MMNFGNFSTPLLKHSIFKLEAENKRGEISGKISRKKIILLKKL